MTGTNRTNRTRAARELQERSSLTYQQALEVVSALGLREFSDPAAVADALRRWRCDRGLPTVAEDEDVNALRLQALAVSHRIGDLLEGLRDGEALAMDVDGELALAGQQLLALLRRTAALVTNPSMLTEVAGELAAALAPPSAGGMRSPDEVNDRFGAAQACLLVELKIFGGCRHCGMPLEQDSTVPGGWTHAKIGRRPSGVPCRDADSVGEPATIAELLPLR